MSKAWNNARYGYSNSHLPLLLRRSSRNRRRLILMNSTSLRTSPTTLWYQNSQDNIKKKLICPNLMTRNSRIWVHLWFPIRLWKKSLRSLAWIVSKMSRNNPKRTNSRVLPANKSINCLKVSASTVFIIHLRKRDYLIRLPKIIWLPNCQKNSVWTAFTTPMKTTNIK